MLDILSETKGPVIDPFMGYGSTGVACKILGIEFVGYERLERPYRKACERIENAAFGVHEYDI